MKCLVLDTNFPQDPLAPAEIEITNGALRMVRLEGVSAQGESAHYKVDAHTGALVHAYPLNEVEIIHRIKDTFIVYGRRSEVTIRVEGLVEIEALTEMLHSAEKTGEESGNVFTFVDDEILEHLLPESTLEDYCLINNFPCSNGLKRMDFWFNSVFCHGTITGTGLEAEDDEDEEEEEEEEPLPESPIQQIALLIDFSLENYATLLRHQLADRCTEEDDLQTLHLNYEALKEASTQGAPTQVASTSDTTLSLQTSVPDSETPAEAVLRPEEINFCPLVAQMANSSLAVIEGPQLRRHTKKRSLYERLSSTFDKWSGIRSSK